MTDLAGYMEMVRGLRKTKPAGWAHSCVEDFLLTHGKSFVPAALPSDIARGPMKACFRNAALLALERPGLAYAEGYALSVIPVLHAWCVDEAGRVVDPTWPDAENCQYHGVVFKRDFLQASLMKHKCFGILGGEFVQMHSLLSGDCDLSQVLDSLPEKTRKASRLKKS